MKVYILFGGSGWGVLPYWKEVLGVFDSLDKLNKVKIKLQGEYGISNYYKNSSTLLWSEEWEVDKFCASFQEDMLQESWFGHG